MNDDLHHSKKDAQKSKKHESKQDSVEEMRAQLQQAKDAELRARADYQNLIRRNQAERQQLIKLASKSLVTDLLQPIEHLALAAQQLNDQGLNMVVTQFWQTLENNGLQEINPVGQPFDVETMEAVEIKDEGNEDEMEVLSVVRRGYRLNGEVIQHAKVVVGKK